MSTEKENTAVLTEEKREETKRLLTAFELIPEGFDRERAIIFLEGMAAGAGAIIKKVTA